MPIHNLRRCSNTSYMYDIDMGCSLKVSTASTKVHGLNTCIRKGFTQLSQSWESVCSGNHVNVKPYAHPHPKKVLKHLIYVCHGHGMQFERFYTLDQCVVAWFAHLHQV
jgi:hypothetical protein